MVVVVVVIRVYVCVCPSHDTQCACVSVCAWRTNNQDAYCLMYKVANDEWNVAQQSSERKNRMKRRGGEKCTGKSYLDGAKIRCLCVCE